MVLTSEKKERGKLEMEKEPQFRINTQHARTTHTDALLTALVLIFDPVADSMDFGHRMSPWQMWLKSDRRLGSSTYKARSPVRMGPKRIGDSPLAQFG